MASLNGASPYTPSILKLSTQHDALSYGQTDHNTILDCTTYMSYQRVHNQQYWLFHVLCICNTSEVHNVFKHCSHAGLLLYSLWHSFMCFNMFSLPCMVWEQTRQHFKYCLMWLPAVTTSSSFSYSVTRFSSTISSVRSVWPQNEQRGCLQYTLPCLLILSELANSVKQIGHLYSPSALWHSWCFISEDLK